MRITNDVNRDYVCAVEVDDLGYVRARDHFFQLTRLSFSLIRCGFSFSNLVVGCFRRVFGDTARPNTCV